MKTNSDYSPITNLAILLVGDPKSGKTCVSAAFPDPYFLDIDGNLASAVRVLGTKKFWFDTPVKNVATADLVWKEALKCLTEAMKSDEVKTIVIDSLSTLAEYMCAWIVSEHKRLGDTDKAGKPIEAMTIPDYGKLLNMFRSLVFDLRKTGKTVICTVHKTTYQDEQSKVTYNVLALPGQAKETLGGAFTDVIGVATTSIPGQASPKYALKTVPVSQFPPLGTSIRTLPHSIDITGKNPAEIWSLLAPMLGMK